MFYKNYNYNSPLIKELSQISQNAEKDYALIRDFPIRFYDGDFIETVLFLCKNLTPSAKVVIFSTATSFSVFGEELNVRLNGQRNKTLNFIIDENQNVDLSLAKNLINFSDDVRAIIVSDLKLVKLAEYVCSIKNIPLILRLDKMLDDGVLNNRIHVYNGEAVDYVRVSVQRHIVIDLESIQKSDNRASCYAQIMSRAVSLLDYRIKTCFKDFVADRFAYELVKQTVLDIFNVFKYSYTKQAEVLVCGLLRIEFANILTSGELDDFSAIKGACYLYGSTQLTMDGIGVLLGLYELGYSDKYDKSLNVVDYNQIALDIKDKGYFGETEILKSLLKRSKNFAKYKKDLSTISNLLISEIQGLKQSFNKMEKTYYALGGKALSETEKTSKQFFFAIKHCGDLPFGFNGMSLLSEKGITETIN